MTADRLRRLLPLGVAATGVVGAHALNYVLAFPDPAVRAHELAATGHGYWPIAVGIALLAGAAAAGLGVANGLRLRRPAPMPVARLAVLQLVLFVTLETAERLGAGMNPIPFLHSPQLVVGVVLQVAVAVAAVLVLRAIEAGARSVGRALRRPLPRAAAAHWAPTLDRVVVSWPASTAPARGPPPLALT